jgi:glycosyltransferase involved in cell wall biosynthesis
MRVLHWYPNFLGGGGVANAVLGLAVGEARLGADVGIAAVKVSGPPLYEPMDRGRGVTILEWEPAYTLRSAGVFVHLVPKRAAHALQVFEPDLVHVHGEFNPDNLWVPRLFKCPMVLSPHGGFHPVVFAKSRRTAKRLYFSAARHLFYRRVRALHALSGFEREHLVRLLPGTQVYCAPQGPNIRTPLSVPWSGRTRTAGEVRFVFVGRLDVFTKGLDLLLEAFAEVERRLRGRRQITLTLVGPDWSGGRATLEGWKQQLGITSPVVFTGSLPSEEVTHTLHDSDIYVQLSRYEGYALSITEALVAGKPTILSTGVGHASYAEITSLPHVRIVPPDVQRAADAMVDFALRLGELNLLADQNRAKVHAFCSWERVARLHLDVYDSIRRAAEVADGAPSCGRRWPAWSSAVSSSSHRPRSVGR